MTTIRPRSRCWPCGTANRPGRCASTRWSRLWQGDRLAVAHAYRRHSTGAPLVRFAVATAGRLGGQRMVAHIQPANVGFFRRLGWRTDGPREIYVGVEHQPMVIDL